MVDNNKIRMVKPGMLTLSIGTGSIRKLQECLNYIYKDVTQTDIEEYHKLLNEGITGDNLPREWMKHIFTLAILVKMLQDVAEGQGLCYDTEINKSSFGLDDIIPE